MGQASSGCGVWRVSVSFITSLFPPRPHSGRARPLRPTVSWWVSGDRELSWGLAASTIWPGWCWGSWGDLSQDAPLGPQAGRWAHLRR